MSIESQLLLAGRVRHLPDPEERKAVVDRFGNELAERHVWLQRKCADLSEFAGGYCVPMSLR